MHSLAINVATAALLTLLVVGILREVRFWRSAEQLASPRLPVTVIVPVRGLDLGAEENLRALTSQDYEGPVEYIFVVDREDDPAVPLVSRFGRVVVAGEAPYPGKSWALSVGMRHARGDVVVFADLDARPPRWWLRALVTPLANGYAASTTYRWYVPLNPCAVVRLAISNMGFAAMLDPRSRFLWGGSTAVRREVVEATGLPSWITRFVSDDYATYRAVKAVGGSIWFSKSAIVATVDRCGLGEVLRWGVRQVSMVRWYAPRGFRVGLAIYTLGFLFGLAIPTAQLLLGLGPPIGYAIPALNLVKDIVRGVYVGRWSGASVRLRHVVAASLVGNIVIPLVVWATAFTRCVEWRGRRYCMDEARRLLAEAGAPATPS